MAPRTRHQVRLASANAFNLLGCDELTVIGWAIFDLDPPSALRFAARCSKVLCVQLHVIIKAASVQRLCLEYVPETRAAGHALGSSRARLWPNGGLKITRNGTHALNDGSCAIAVASAPLPCSGRWRWSVTVTAAAHDAGYHRIGVCNAAGTAGWGYNPCSGTVFIEAHDATEGVRNITEVEHIALRQNDGAPIVGAPRPMYSACNHTGRVVHLLFDANRGTLSFESHSPLGAPGFSMVEAVRNLPAGAYRPWVLLLWRGDAVSISPYYSSA
jgi:hypothetical protein